MVKTEENGVEILFVLLKMRTSTGLVAAGLCSLSIRFPGQTGGRRPV